MIQKHFDYTSSKKAELILDNWEEVISKFVKVIPKDYKRMMERIEEQMQAGLTDEDAAMSAFEANAITDKKGSVASTNRSEAIVQ